MSDLNNMNSNVGQPAGQPSAHPAGQPHPSMPLPNQSQPLGAASVQPQSQPAARPVSQPLSGAQSAYSQSQSGYQVASPTSQAASSAGQVGQAGQPAQSQAQTTPSATHATAHATSSAAQSVTPSASQAAQTATVVPQHAQAPKKGGGAKTFLIAFVGAALGCVLAFMGMSFFPTDTGSNTPASQTTSDLGASESTGIDISADDATLATAVAAKCLPSVAAVDVYARSTNNYSNIYGFGFGPDSGSDELSASGLGSGVVLSNDGYVVTNYHVISGGERFEVTLDGETYEATLVGTDPSSDLAVLKCQNATDLTAMEIGDSDDLVIGEWVMSIGSPFGLEQSVATGIVSATSRSQIMDSSETGSGVTIYPNMIQTDAAINPGNSGGALVDSNGQLIGINTLITSYSGNYSGVGFAIPVNYAINIAQQIIDGEAPTHAQLGVSLVSINAQMAARYGLAVDAGAYVSAVAPGTGAADAGLEEGDIITAFDGDKVESASDLMLDVRTKNPGDTVTLTVVTEDGTSHEVDVVLGADTTQRS